MTWDKLVKLLQLTGAALAIPAAAAGTYSAYRTYFTSEVSCSRLRSAILEIMEKKVAPDVKRTLLRKDVTDFLKDCGENDPDTRSIFQSAIAEPQQVASRSSGEGGAPRGGGRPGGVGLPPASQVEIFGGAGERGWVALGRREANAWMANFTGKGLSESTMPPPGTILTSQRMLPVWAEPQGTTNDMSKLQGRLPASTCVRVVGTHVGPNRLWAEITPAPCS